MALVLWVVQHRIKVTIGVMNLEFISKGYAFILLDFNTAAHNSHYGNYTLILFQDVLNTGFLELVLITLDHAVSFADPTTRL